MANPYSQIHTRAKRLRQRPITATAVHAYRRRSMSRGNPEYAKQSGKCRDCMNKAKNQRLQT